MSEVNVATKNWPAIKFIDCIEPNSLKKLKGIKKKEYSTEGIYPIFDQGQNYISGFTNNENLLNNNYPAILFGDHTRIVKFIDQPFVVGADGTKVFRSKKDINSKFLYYSLLNLNIPNTGYNRHFKWVKAAKILLPPIAYQEKIVEILSAVDDSIAKTEQIIKKTEELKNGLANEILIRGIGNKKFKKTELGEVPDDWQIKKISELLNYEQPNEYIVKNTNYFDSINKGLAPVLTANKSFILGYTDESFGIYENIPVIIFDDFTTDSKFVDFPFKVKSSAIKILKEKNKNINLRFVYEKIKLLNFATGSHKRYYISRFQNLKMAVPAKTEQDQIVDILNSVDTKIDINKKIKNKLIKLREGLMQTLLHG